MIDKSLARGLARMTLREIAEANDSPEEAAPATKSTNGRKKRAAALRSVLKEYGKLALCQEVDPNAGYGGAAAYVRFDTAGTREIRIKSIVLFGARNDASALHEAYGPSLVLTEHACQRLHQRKSLWTVDELRSAFSPAVYSLLALMWAAGASSLHKPGLLKQLSLPCLEAAECDQHIRPKAHSQYDEPTSTAPFGGRMGNR